MTMDHQSLWTYQNFAVVCHPARKNFSSITFNKLKQLSKKGFPVDRSIDQVDGDRTYLDLPALPEKVEAVKNRSVIIKLEEFLFCQRFYNIYSDSIIHSILS